jgi:hypothetical protein
VGQLRIYSDTLREASLALGGAAPLALRLDVPVDAVNKWISGEEEPPLDIFLESLEIIAEGPWRVTKVG